MTGMENTFRLKHRVELKLDDEDREALTSLNRDYGTDAQAIRVAIRRLAKKGDKDA